MDYQGNLPLHKVCLEGHDYGANLLIAWSNNLNAKNNAGMTALHFATIAKNYRIIRCLLIRGSSRDIVDN